MSTPKDADKAVQDTPAEPPKKEPLKPNIIKATPDMKVPDVVPADQVVIPKRIETKNASGKIRRPRNAFIIFRSHQHKVFVDSFIKDNKPVPHNSEISKMIGAQWKSLNAEEKQVWVDAADKEKTDHLNEHPDYKYQPVRRKVKKELKAKEKVLKNHKLKAAGTFSNQADVNNNKIEEPKLSVNPKIDRKDSKDENYTKGFTSLYDMNQQNPTTHLNAVIKENNTAPNTQYNYVSQGPSVGADRFQMEQYQHLKQLEQLKQMEQMRYMQQQHYMMMQQQMLQQQQEQPQRKSIHSEGQEQEYYQRMGYPVEENGQYEEPQQPIGNAYMQQQYYMHMQEQANKGYGQDVAYEYHYPQNKAVPYTNFVGYQTYPQQESSSAKPQQNPQYLPQQQYNQYYNYQQGYYYGGEYPQNGEYNA